MKKLLKQQDHFSYTFQLYFLGKKSNHTIIGIVLSSIINIFCIVMTLLYLIELLNHSKPKVNYSKISKKLNTNITLNTKELLYTIGFRDKNYQVLADPTIASLLPVYERMHTDEHGIFKQEQIELDIINCTILLPLFKELDVVDQFYSNGVQNYYCFNGTSLGEDIVLGGKYGSKFYGNLAIFVKKCTNSSENLSKGIICQDEKVINDKVQDAWVEITYASAFIDSDNYTNPIQYILDGYYTRLDHTINKMLYTYFNLVNFYSENNWLLSHEKHEWAIKEEIETTDLNLENSDGTIFTAYVCPSFTVENYKRSYIKIQEIGANVSGLFKSIFLICYVFVSFYQNQLSEVTMINYIIEHSHKNKPESRKPSSIIKVPMLNYRHTKIKRPISSTKLSRMETVSLGDMINMVLFNCFYRNHQKINDIKYYQRKRNRYLDYTQIIKILIDLESNNSRFFEQTKSFIECNETSQQILNNSEINKTPITTEKIETNNTLLRINNKKTFPKQD